MKLMLLFLLVSSSLGANYIIEYYQLKKEKKFISDQPLSQIIKEYFDHVNQIPVLLNNSNSLLATHYNHFFRDYDKEIFFLLKVQQAIPYIVAEENKRVLNEEITARITRLKCLLVALDPEPSN